eukprot:943820-Alexandrium_andersonii.AAC.1
MPCRPARARSPSALHCRHSDGEMPCRLARARSPSAVHCSHSDTEDTAVSVHWRPKGRGCRASRAGNPNSPKR